jgi:hypothetical protein
MPTVIVPSIGDVTDPETIQQIYDDIDALENDVADIATNGTVIARGNRQTNSTAASAETGVIRLDNIPMASGRVYWIGTNGLSIDTTVSNDIARILLRINTAGVATTGSTNIWLGQVRLADNGAAEQVAAGVLYQPAGAVTASVLLSHTRAGGTGNIQVMGSSVLPVDLWVVDLGEDPGDTGTDI